MEKSVRERLVKKAITRHQNLHIKNPSETMQQIYLDFSEKIQNQSNPNSEQIERREKEALIQTLEQFLQDICQSIQENQLIKKDLIAEIPKISGVLQRCYQDLPGFSTKFYVLMGQTLNLISNLKDRSSYIKIAQNMMKLADFFSMYNKEEELKENCEQLNKLIELSEKLNILVIGVRIKQDFKSRLQNKEPYKSLCMGFIQLYKEVDQSIILTSKLFSSRAVNYMKNYLQIPTNFLKTIKNTEDYIQKNIFSYESVANCKQTLEKISQQIKAKSTPRSSKILYRFLQAVTDYHQYCQTNQPISSQIQQSLDSNSWQSQVQFQPFSLIAEQSSIFSQQDRKIPIFQTRISTPEKQQKSPSPIVSVKPISISSPQIYDIIPDFTPVLNEEKPRQKYPGLKMLDQALKQSKEVLRSKSPQYRTKTRSASPFGHPPKLIQTSLQQIVTVCQPDPIFQLKKALKDFIVRKIQENPKINLFPNKEKLLKQFFQTQPKESQKQMSLLKDDSTYREIVNQAHKLTNRRMNSCSILSYRKGLLSQKLQKNRVLNKKMS